MTTPLNVCLLAQASAALDEGAFLAYERYLSNRGEKLKYREVELATIRGLMAFLDPAGQLPLSLFDGFAYSYSMKQLGNEFDLLKIADDRAINIELKSMAERDRVRRQLVRNRHYLSHLGVPVRMFSYVYDTNTLFVLEGDELREASAEELLAELRAADAYYQGDFDQRFRTSDFLISPINSTERFLAGAYFLTQQQEDIKRQVITRIAKGTGAIACIKGSPGTGKSLVLYDLALELSGATKACIVHGAALTDAHRSFNQLQDRIEVVAAADAAPLDSARYTAVLIDEAHRVPTKTLQAIIDECALAGTPLIVGLDASQVLTPAERARDVQAWLEATCPDLAEFTLSDKIRTNKQIASFIRGLLHLDQADLDGDYSDVHLSFATTYAEAERQIRAWEQKGYQYIHFSDVGECAGIGGCIRTERSLGTHDVVGQEFDSVAMVIPEGAFVYVDGELRAREHACPEYLFDQLLFQGMTRTREELALVFVGDVELFSQVVKYAIR